MKVTEKLQNYKNSMTDIEKKIYNLILTSPREFSLKSIGEVADVLNVSKTSLVRFAKNIGYKGYSEFRKILLEEEIMDISPVEKLKIAIDENNCSNCAEKIRKTEFNNITETFIKLNPKDIDKFIDSILAANEFYTMGWGVSSYLAEIFSLRLKSIGINVQRIERGKTTLVEQIVQLNMGDKLVVFEFPRYVYEVLDAVEVAYKKGVSIILVTDKQNCPITAYSILNFYCSTKTEFFGNSLVGPMFFINVITSEIMIRTKSKAFNMLQEQKKVLDSGRYYI